ncbi:D-alanyl-D-alanine carboxypeptidase [Alphaproteobacteria bacterium]|nr:D-alanyl-D-alanine carboxypeptidase [Alphaproteobacteria bacterium]
MKFFILLIINLLLSLNALAVDTKAEQAIVFDYNTGEVLFEKNADQKMPPASMTKIMTVYVAFDRIKETNLSVNHLCTISPRAYKMRGSRTYLEIDDKVSIDVLLKGIIVQSGNDASVALAECLSGTEEDFAKLMNVYAKNMGMLNTNFINSSGWPNEDHFSTVRDLGFLSNKIIQDFPDLYEYFAMKEFLHNEINQPNRNRLLKGVVGSDGLKTGYTKKSGWGISGSAKRDNRRITVVINGTNSSRSRFNESSYLIDWAFNQTSEVKLFKKGEVIKNVDVWLGSKPTINLVIQEDVISILSFDQIKLIKTSINYSKPINAPIKNGDILGNIIISVPGKDEIDVPLIAQNDIKEVNPLMKSFAAIKYLIFGTSLDEK